MARKNKFIKGEIITDPLLVFSLLLKRQWLYWEDKPRHPSWLISMQFNSLRFAAERGLISLALPNPERKNDE